MASDVVIEFKPPSGHHREVSRVAIADLPVTEYLGDGFTASVDLSSDADREALIKASFQGEPQPDSFRFLDGIPCLELWQDGDLAALASLSGSISNDNGYGLADNARLAGHLAFAGLICIPGLDALIASEKLAIAVEGQLNTCMDALFEACRGEVKIVALMGMVRVQSDDDKELCEALTVMSRRFSKMLREEALCDASFGFAFRNLVIK